MLPTILLPLPLLLLLFPLYVNQRTLLWAGAHVTLSYFAPIWGSIYVKGVEPWLKVSLTFFHPVTLLT